MALWGHRNTFTVTTIIDTGLSYNAMHRCWLTAGVVGNADILVTATSVSGKVDIMVSTYSSRTTQPRMFVRTSSLKVRSLYRSTRFGYKIAGTHRWEVVGSNTVSNDPITEDVALQMQGIGSAEVHVIGANRWDVLDSADTVRYWKSEDYLAEFMESGTLVVLTDRNRSAAGVVMVSPGVETGTPMVTVKEAYDLTSNTAVRVTLTTELASVHETYRSMQHALQIDHKGLFRLFSKDVLQAVLA